ncbi:MAG TPA: proline dehydrogenase family protein [Thermomicrobiales bacterium]|nr:proline dehydrogenase family protein [Thermomicrobiales bacterium]
MMQLMRQVVLGVADNQYVSRFFQTSRLTRSLVDRFVAGETLDEALVACRAIAASGMALTLDQLGENVHTREAAEVACDIYVDILCRLHAEGLERNISVKLTMLGLDLGDEVAHDAMVRVLETAREVGGFVRIDMEGSAYTERTMRMFTKLHDRFPDEVGIVIQAYLHRAEQDVRDMIARNARVRLVKGAYAEPASVAYQDSGKIDENYVRLMKLLLDEGNFPALATHDPALIQAAQAHARERQIPLDRFEFQMLYGVRGDEQERLTKAGYGMRVYVPYGTEWYPYFTRRIAERPANALFVLRQLVNR